jgi:hypothetical protein
MPTVMLYNVEGLGPVIQAKPFAAILSGLSEVMFDPKGREAAITMKDVVIMNMRAAQDTAVIRLACEYHQR